MWLILGAEGQLGLSLQLVLSQNHIPFRRLGRSSLDISNRDQYEQIFNEMTPSIVVNCAAWTAVDLAEDHEEEAFSVNLAIAFNAPFSNDFRSLLHCLH